MAKSAEFVTLVPIRNMTRAIRFYTKQLGGRLVMRGTGTMKNYWASMNVAGHQIWLVAPQKREKRSLAYMTLVVKDAKRFVRALQRRGVKFNRAEPMSPDSKVDGPLVVEKYGTSAFFKDPEGNLWMVWQNSSWM
jgi:catechol 2,3-dioxygenase-like lactoylglutathione lyase family enzyme